MIEHRVVRRRSTLRVTLEVQLGELLGALDSAERTAIMRDRLSAYCEGVVRDILEVGGIVAQEPEHGIVKWFDESLGYGFITDHNRQDVFVHHKQIAGDGFKNLASGQQVSFKRRMGRTTYEALDVTPIESAE